MTKRDVYPLYTVRDLLEIPDDPEPWIVRNVIPKAGRILVYGSGGSYKSAICFDMAVAIASTGLLMEQMPIEHYGPVVILSTEGTLQTMRKRLLGHMRTRNVIPDSIQLFLGRRPLFLDVKHEFDVLVSIIKKLKPSMVVLDPYASFMSTNENDTEETKKLTRALNDIIEEYACAVVIIHHANKAGEMRGSTVLQGWADTILKFCAKRKQQVPGLDGAHDILTVEVEKQRDGPMGTAFSAVPFIDEQLGMISFGVYYGMDAKMVTATKLKLDLLRLFKASGAAFTRADLCQHFRVGREKLDIALAWLIRDHLIQEVAVEKSTGGDRLRHINAYMSATAGSRIDQARAIFVAERMLSNEEDDEYLC